MEVKFSKCFSFAIFTHLEIDYSEFLFHRKSKHFEQYKGVHLKYYRSGYFAENLFSPIIDIQ